MEMLIPYPDQGVISKRSCAPSGPVDIFLFLAKRHDTKALRIDRGPYIPADDPESPLLKWMICSKVIHVHHVLSINLIRAQIWKPAEQSTKCDIQLAPSEVMANAHATTAGEGNKTLVALMECRRVGPAGGIKNFGVWEGFGVVMHHPGGHACDRLFIISE